MAYNPRQDTGPGYQAGSDVTENIDPGLRRYMLRVYNFMAGGRASINRSPGHR